MNTDWERIKQVLAEAAARNSPAERVAYLDGACRGDDGLRAEVEKLLVAHDQAGAFLEDPIAPPQHSTIAVPATVTEKPGDKIGHYKLLQQIGEGGCGVVYMAEQEEPIRRRVALKVIKLGMDTKQVVARFEAERQALALMDHPNIATVLDAGATDAGRPYFVMELVRGIKITDYCDQSNLPTEERLNLFVQICHAIQHAHQKGIIHRDIKPSNILVTINDGVPVPKIIDFGIAKATEQRLTDKTLFTAYEQFIGTPAYMSPEQAVMTSLDIDTRSDVYALGVLLYELLTGKPPFDQKELIAAGLDEMRRIIREQEPLRPSARLSALEDAERTTVAKCRHLEPPQLIHLVRGDLDWIVMKCLEKDRTRRYATANGLAEDVLRHLKDEPVVACPPSKLYRFQKLVRRNKLVFAGISAVAAVLILGIVTGTWQAVLILGVVTSTWQAVRATHAKRAALVAQAREAVQREEAIEAQANEARLRKQAEAQELVARQRAYASDMNVAKQALDGNNLGRVLDLLNRQRPAPGQKDLRGWEWRYLWQQTRSDASFTLCKLSAAVNPLAVSPDGNWLAIGAWQKDGLSLWDLRTRKELVRLAKTEGFCQAAFSPAEPLLAFSGGALSSSGEERWTVHFWNLVTQQIIAEISVGEHCMKFEFSKDGRTLVTSSRETYSVKGHITLWRVPDGTLLASYPADQTYHFATTRDLSLAAYELRAGGQVCVIDLRNGKELWTAVTSKEYISALAFSPDGKTLATAAGTSEPHIRLWDVATGKEMGQMKGHGSWVRSLLFWPDGKKLASSGEDQTIRTWDVASRTCLDILRGGEAVLRLALLPDEKTLVSGGRNGTVSFWDTSLTHPRELCLCIPENAIKWCFSTDSQSVLTLNEQGQVSLWGGSDFQQKEPLLEIETNGDSAYQFSKGGRFLSARCENGGIKIWDVSQRLLWRQLAGAASYGTPISFFADDKKLITLTWSLSVDPPPKGSSISNVVCHEWDLTTGLEVQSWDVPPEAFSDAGGVVSPDGRWFVCPGFWRGGAAVRNLADKSYLKVDLDVLRVWEVCFSPDGKLLAAASALSYARVWDAATWRQVATLGGFLNVASSVAFSPDGSRLAVASGDKEAVRLFDTASWQDVLTLECQGTGFAGVKFSPDGNTIAWGNRNALYAWRAPSWEEINAAEKAAPASPP